MEINTSFAYTEKGCNTENFKPPWSAARPIEMNYRRELYSSYELQLSFA
jgi:hypothetical protein